jgi:hypothetical protein
MLSKKRLPPANWFKSIDSRCPWGEAHWEKVMPALWRLFGRIFWSFRLHCKNLTARGVDSNLFGVFDPGFAI